MNAPDIYDYQAISDTLGYYLDGAKAGKADLMRPAFHATATVDGYEGAELKTAPIQTLFDWVDQNGPAEDIVAKITSIEVVGTIAVARVESDNWLGSRFSDFLTLLKVDGQWKIVNKVFHLHS